MSTWRILVVEDDENAQEILRGVLEHAEIIVDEAHNATQALELLDQYTYTAVLIDLSLPGKSGWDLLTHIRQNEQTANLPCFANTAYHSPRVASDAIAAGFDHYFAKPINLITLVDDLREYLPEQ